MGKVLLLDANCSYLKPNLSKEGYDVVTVYELIRDRLPLRSDYSIIKYAIANDMIIITADKEIELSCRENDYNPPCVHILTLERQVLVDIIKRRVKLIEERERKASELVVWFRNLIDSPEWKEYEPMLRMAKECIEACKQIEALIPKQHYITRASDHS